MSERVLFHERGLHDYEELLRGYTAIRKELGTRVKETFQKIAERHVDFPESGHPVIKGYRYFRLTPFPYKVFYKPGRAAITIMTICHDRRHDRAWKSFLRRPRP